MDIEAEKTPEAPELTPYEQYYSVRFENWRALGEDWATASAWAHADADDLYGSGRL